MSSVSNGDHKASTSHSNVIPFPKARVMRDDSHFQECKRKLATSLFELYDYMDAAAIREVLGCFDEVFRTVEELEADGQYFSGAELQNHWDKHSQDTGTGR